MKTIYFVRHGETEGNTGKIYQGIDTPLMEAGLEQARLVADRCAHLKVTAMVTSDALRAQQTAQIISAKTGMDFETSPLFAERRRRMASILMTSSRAPVRHSRSSRSIHLMTFWSLRTAFSCARF